MVRWRQLLRQLVAVTAVFGYATSDESQERENDERQRHYVNSTSNKAPGKSIIMHLSVDFEAP